MPTNYNGHLNSNALYSSIFNMIIGQTVNTPLVGKVLGSNLLESAKVDGSLYGDTKLFYDTDVLGSYEFGMDSDLNVLETKRGVQPKCQAITIDQYRQIALTTDNFISKQAWGNEGAFNEFQSQLIGWMATTKRIYETTLFCSVFGTTKATDQAVNEVSLTLGTGTEAQDIAKGIEDLIYAMEDVSRDYNSYGYLRAVPSDAVKIVWNQKFASKIKLVDLPTIYHTEGLFKDGEVLPARYFGNVNATAGTTAASNTTIRSLIEKDYNTVARSHANYDPKKHIFPGDLLPNSTAYGANETYTVDSNVICMVVGKDAFKMMSAFETESSFYNAKNLSENHYLTWGYSYPTFLYGKPVVRVKKSA